MNVLIVDTEKVDINNICKIFNDSTNDNKLGEFILLPKGIDIIQDISVDWMKMIRDVLNEKIKEAEDTESK